MSTLFSQHQILTPIVVLVLWTLIMEIWMLATRMQAMNAAGLDPQAAARAIDLGPQLPDAAQFKADNYNHLMEQPTIFYALALALSIAGLGVGLNLACAWIYVGSRIAHSLVQATFNKVLVRFSLYLIGSIALAVMAVNAALKLMS
ncbi:MAG TPA: MAPEG family protein [Pseudomonadales bacterium]|nr:MAPEG family protein [Pseudomonadales bacterium]